MELIIVFLVALSMSAIQYKTVQDIDYFLLTGYVTVISAILIGVSKCLTYLV